VHILSETGERIELELVSMPLLADMAAAPTAMLDVLFDAAPVRASRAIFELGRGERLAGRSRRAGPPPAVFRDGASGLVRTAFREIVVRFTPDTPDRVRRAALRKHGLEVKRENAFVPGQVVVAPRSRARAGVDLLDIANDYAGMDEVVFATPNFVSEFRRGARGTPPVEQWHLRNLARVAGQKRREDIHAVEAWKTTTGKRAIVIAIVDDGVDVDHPDLKTRIWRNPNRSANDRNGRDFFLPDDDPDHFNPRPKRFQFPFDDATGNDIHGTPCAGVAAAAGNAAFGAAWRSRILPIKIFHANELAPEERVADAIRYAAQIADVISCSWYGPRTPDVALALQDVGRIGRGGMGSAVFCATGNGGHRPVSFPASNPNSIAVGASTDEAKLASYSNVGPEVDVVAPSHGGRQAVFTTDVSYPGRGYNPGDSNRGGTNGLYTNDFGGTSSATPLAAGVAALVLSVNPKLNRDDLRALLRDTADKIGSGYDAGGHSKEFGHGRINAQRAVAAAAAG
jgi:subtilisin family serine protease